MASGPVALRARRLECGFTQAELARRAGVSRQLVAAAEAGHNAPTVEAALALARALGTTVEAVFAPAQPPVTSALGGDLPEGAMVRVGRVGDRLVAAELADHGAAGSGWARPDGVIEAGELRLFADAVPAGLVIAGCDPVLGIAEAALQGLGGRSLLALSAPTGAAIRSLERGDVHAAVVHGPAAELPTATVPVTRVHLTRWQVGLGVPGRSQVRSVADALHGGLAVAQRPATAASQQALVRAAASTGATFAAGPVGAGHIDTARIAAILDCAAVTTQAAASAFGLDFLPLEDHTVQIWIAQRWLDHPGAEALRELLVSAGFGDRLVRLPGYDGAGCGATVTTD